jgi:hypothetical protein
MPVSWPDIYGLSVIAMFATKPLFLSIIRREPRESCRPACAFYKYLTVRAERNRNGTAILDT